MRRSVHLWAGSRHLAADYFAFMSDKWTSKDPASRNSMAAAPKKPPRQSDTIDFVDESQIEVIESVVSDTMIERIFKQFKQF